MIITIDGPAGSGKSTAARNLAAKLNIAYLDTGATYRAATLAALKAGVDLEDEQALERIVRDMKLQMKSEPDGVHVFLAGQDVTREIRSAAVTDKAHHIATLPAVRKILVALQRRLGCQLGEFVAEGRDQGSVVFPDADLKFYLVAAPEARARRRYEEMRAAGEDAKLDEVLDAILQRDRRDRSRDIAPLVKPAGAIELDTTDNTMEQTAEQLLKLVEAAG